MAIQQDHMSRFFDDNDLLENPETNGQKADFEQSIYDAIDKEEFIEEYQKDWQGTSMYPLN